MKLLFVLLLPIIAANAQIKIGGNPTVVNPSALVELESTTQGFLPPRMSTAQRDAITNPATSLVIYNTTLNCLQLNLGTPASPKWECLGGDPSSNGSANVSAYDCSTGSTGSMRSGVPVSGVTQTVTATVVTPGTYFITASANGVTYFGSGAFAAAGSQEILLTAIGTPIATGTFTYTLNTTPTCSFDVDVTNGTSGGTAAVTSWSCNTGSAGTLITGQTVSGVTQTVTADVATPGTYNISATNNGVTFEASGTFAGTGPQTVVLTAVGTPEADGTYSYVLNVSNGCNFNRTSVSQPVVSSLDCGNATLTGTVLSGTPANGAFVSIPYTGGNGASYNTQLISSTGVTGLTALLNSGTLANGNGDLIFSISGTANTSGNAFFALTFGGQSCTFAVLVETPAAVATLDCAGSTPVGTLEADTPASGVTQTIPYTGGNGGIYGALSFVSTGVTGLTATAPADTIASGNGNLELTITGTPITVGTATFNVTFGGINCTFARNVDLVAAQGTMNCAGITVNGTYLQDTSLNTANILTVPVIVSDTGTYVINSNTVNGYNFSGSGSFSSTGVQNVTLQGTGTPVMAGTDVFTIGFGNTCNVSVEVASGAALLNTLDCGGSTVTGSVTAGIGAAGVSVAVPYTGGNGGGYAAISINSTGVAGLTASAPAGNVAAGNGSLVLTISGTAGTAGTASFLLNLGGQSCTFSVVVNGPVALACASATTTQTPLGALINGTTYTGTVTIPYVIGNGQPYASVTIGPNSGLSLTRVAGTYAAGGGNIVYNLSGTYTGSSGELLYFSLPEGCPSYLFGCGGSFTVTHTEGDVAPVNKTVTYETVRTNLTTSTGYPTGGTYKCWITRNLGADQQATSATDATEQSAGWYWQFNRKQGYKHDGTTRTPNTTWNSIDENTNWFLADDPCNLLLGNSWRLPTYVEWTNLEVNGGWLNLSDAYNSELKLHASGQIDPGLSSRGSIGRFSSSIQDDTTTRWVARASGSLFQIELATKRVGFPIRCLKD